jgi:CrcB protein
MLLWTALAGGVGAVARLVLDGVVRSRTGSGYPAGTMLINLTGSLLLGLVVGLTGGLLPETARLVVGTGFLGGYTTFSTAAVETVRLVADRRWSAAAGHGLLMLAGGVGLAGLGLWLGRALVG